MSVSRETSSACVRRPGAWTEWCVTHHAWFVTGRPFCWATVRPGDVDPLSALPPEPLLGERPVVDDRGMIVFWIAAVVGLLLTFAGAAWIIAQRAPGG